MEKMGETNKKKKKRQINVNKLGKAAVVSADTSSTELALGSCEAEADMRAPEDETLRMGQNGLASIKGSQTSQYSVLKSRSLAV